MSELQGPPAPGVSLGSGTTLGRVLVRLAQHDGMPGQASRGSVSQGVAPCLGTAWHHHPDQLSTVTLHGRTTTALRHRDAFPRWVRVHSPVARPLPFRLPTDV